MKIYHNKLLIKKFILYWICRIQAELLKNESAEVDTEVMSKITAQDFEDASNEEFAQFQFASINTGENIIF